MKTRKGEGHVTPGGGLGGCGICVFRPFINEEEMVKCIANVRIIFMGDKKRCHICGLPCNHTDFCLLIFYALRRMNFLATDAQSPFCTFLKERVFRDEGKPEVRTFNLYANKLLYKDFEQLLFGNMVNGKKIAFNPADSVPQAYQNNLCYVACHKIAESFHDMPYFQYLQKQKDALQYLVL